MAVELMPSYGNSNFVSQSEETAAEEAASGLKSVEKLLRLFSPDGAAAEVKDYATVAGAAVSKFKRVISLLDRTRTGHARFRRAPVAANSPVSSSTSPNSVLRCAAGEPAQVRPEDGGYGKIYSPTPIQQVPPPDYYHKMVENFKEKTISFSYAPPVIPRADSFVSSVTESKQQQPCAFQMMSASSGGKPPLCSSSSFKRKCCSSENGASGKCSGSSGRCHCKRRYIDSKTLIVHTQLVLFPFQTKHTPLQTTMRFVWDEGE